MGESRRRRLAGQTPEGGKGDWKRLPPEQTRVIVQAAVSKAISDVKYMYGEMNKPMKK